MQNILLNNLILTCR